MPSHVRTAVVCRGLGQIARPLECRTSSAAFIRQDKSIGRFSVGARIAYNHAQFHTSLPRNSAWAAAVSVASNMVSNVVKPSSQNPEMTIDPLRAVAKEMKALMGNVRNLIGSGHPSLDKVAKYYTQSEGKHTEPRSRINTSISPLAVLSDDNPTFRVAPPPPPSPHLDPAAPMVVDAAEAAANAAAGINASQRRLAEISELIHTASLLHDDVIDFSEARRGAPSANHQFGNKMAVLTGDFLLARASLALARLRNPEVQELLASVIANLVEGEFMQLKNTAEDETNPVWSEETLSYYLHKTYLKTASLISKSCRASAILGGSDDATVDAAYAYGKNLGLAFQLVDDMLDYTRSEKELGKPAGADLQLGLATAPLLFAWKSMRELGPLVGRRFEREGDVERARDLVYRSDGIEQTRALAKEYADKAIAATAAFPASEAKDGLVEMASKALKRTK